jgi:hypothetical protein
MAWGVDFGIAELREFGSDPINGNTGGGTLLSDFFGAPCGYPNNQFKITITLFGNKEGADLGQPLTWADVNTVKIRFYSAFPANVNHWFVVQVNASEFAWTVGNTVLTIPENHVFSSGIINVGYNGPCNLNPSELYSLTVGPTFSQPNIFNVFDPNDPLMIFGCPNFPECTFSTNRNLQVIVPSINGPCAISSLSIVESFPCNPETNTYSVTVEVTYTNAPAAGNLIVNGQTFAITSSPQDCLLTGLPADGLPVDVTAIFGAEPACNLTVPGLYTAPNSCSCVETYQIFDGTNWVNPCDCNVNIMDSTNTWQRVDPANCPTRYWDGTQWVLIECP